jgi:hypothetical protein
MSQSGEVDPTMTPYRWDWLMIPLTDMFGPELVYAVGMKVLGYPPTWVDMKQEEADLVEAAVIKFLERKNEC